ncbi:MAG: permease [Candidatus Omnitrophica bacterium]|nr:permease [Candidatus Omnitrophota bacterium]
MEKSSCCSQEKAACRRWITDKTVVTCLTLLGLVGLSAVWPRLEPFRHAFFSYLRMVAGPMLAGFLLGGVIERFVPREYISLILARKKKRTILTSVFLGFLMSACSHGILALSMQLHKKGASTPVVIGFLLASPWANLPITFILFGFFGLKALFIVGGALGVAFLTGVVFQFLEKKGLIESNPKTLEVPAGFSIAGDIRKRFRETRFSTAGTLADGRAVLRGAWSLADMTLWWLLIGIGISGLAAAFIPPEFFRRAMGPTFAGLLVTLLFAAILEVCSEGTAPVAFEIFRQTGAFGNAFVFLMAGVVTDYTEIGLVWANIGRRAALWLPAVAVPQILALGFLANLLF